MFNNYPIFKRVVLNQIYSKINIVLFCIFILAFVGSTVYGIISANLSIFGWVSFALLLIYVTFFNLFFVGSSYNKDLDLGVTNLEIRSGYKNDSIFFQRLFAQKTYILPIEILFFFIWFFLGLFSGVSYIQMSTVQLVFGMLTIFIYEVLISSFLLLFASFRNAIATTFFGVIIGILFAVMPLFAILDSYVNSNVVMNEQEFSKKTMQKFAILDEFDQIRNDHKNENGIIDSQVSIVFPKDTKNSKDKTSSFFEMFTLYDDYFLHDVRGTGTAVIVKNVKQNYDINNERDKYPPESTATFMSRSYVNDLIYNGLAAELIENKLPLITSTSDEHFFNDFINNEKNKTYKDKYLKLIKNNSVLNFINVINNLDKKFISDKESSYENSFFTLDSNKNKRFTGATGFDNFIYFLKNQSWATSEMNEIIDIVNQTAKFSYVNSYETFNPRSSIFDIGGSNSDNLNISAADTNLWLTTNANDTEKKWLGVSSDGARVFFKVYFDILREYIKNDAPQYNIGNINSDDQLIDPETYLKKMRTKMLINPGMMFTSLFYNSGYNKVFQNSQNDFFNPFVTYVYGFDESIKNTNNINNYLNLVPNPNGSGLADVLMWDLDKDPIVNKGDFINKMKKLITYNSGSLKDDQIDFKFIRLLNSPNKLILNGLVAYSTDDKWFGERNFSVQFKNGSDDSLSATHKKLIDDDIEDSIKKDPTKKLNDEKPTKADIYKFGKNDGQLEYIGSTFNVWIPLSILVISAGVLLELSWVIFNRRIIK
ncbi:hypothetical protein STIUS_v1c04960 [Spiroplasma sp. TIUS-1]|uniref:hypothetical protein n=1 Tax=Spiroplasma sp. TIUS-1 TaxID=216963 RepID=UPI00139809F3|nr:hypothetical protein [Spiroplasma sp. TIUS-1]QHX36050.1 hypothetical protein STIUS_v1c04960 [Spiroplasma sp. TIUS-1]